MAASFVTSSLHLGHIATAMLPLCNNELTERCYHFGLTFVMKRPLNEKFTAVSGWFRCEQSMSNVVLAGLFF